MVRRSGSGPRRRRRWYVAGSIAACVATGAIAAAVLLPQYYSNATSTGVSTLYKTATNETDGSTASSSDAPGGATTGTAKPGDTLKWVVGYQNETSANATVSLTDLLTDAGTYIAGSLELPPNQNPSGTTSPQFSTDAGATWKQGDPPAGASGIGLSKTFAPPGTQQLSPPFVATTSALITMQGGDGYNAVVHNGQVYTIYHHSPGPYVYCSQLDGGACPGFGSAKVQSWSATPGTAVGTGTPFAGRTSNQSGTWLEGSRLHWYAGPLDGSSAGVACLELSTMPATSCGYTARTGKVVSNITYSAQVGGTGMPASNGNYYSSTVNNGSGSIMCVTPVGGPCAGVPSLMTGVSSPNVYTSASFGDFVFASVQQTASSSWQTYCYNVKSGLCPGSWPVITSAPVAKAGPPYAPILSSSGALTGLCTITNGTGSLSQCWNLLGSPAATNPYAGTGANFNAGGNGTGDAFVVGAKVYLSAGDTVMCRNFGAYSGSGAVPDCAGFSRPGNAKNYTVRPASEIGVECLVATGDSGEVIFFNALTGGSCASATPQSLTVTPESFYCGTGAASFTSWGKLTLPGLVATAYAGSAVTLRDQANRVIPGFDNVTLAPGASLDLASIPKTVTTLFATVTVLGVRDTTGVRSGQISISWRGDPPQLCFRTIAPPVSCDAVAAQTLSNTAMAVTTSTAGSDAPRGNTTGAVRFTEQPIDSQCSLAIAKTSPVQSARPGDTVAYAITVRNTGSQAYDTASFSDDVTDVLKEAAFLGDQAASSGSVSYAPPVLSWSGALAPGAAATITYSVRVNSPDIGDHRLLNTVVSPTRGSNCTPDSTDAACTVTVTVDVTDLLWHKIDATQARNVLPGASWTLTPVDQTGRPSGPALVVMDCDEDAASLCHGLDRDPVGGLFRLTDLGPGTYHLVETRAPVGFRIDPTPIPVTISATTLTVALPEVVNHQLPVPAIPLTGGLGSDLLTYSGAGLLAAVGILAGVQVMRRRRATA